MSTWGIRARVRPPLPGSDLGGVWEVVLGFALGGVALAAADRFVPHLHLRFFECRHLVLDNAFG